MKLTAELKGEWPTFLLRIFLISTNTGWRFQANLRRIQAMKIACLAAIVFTVCACSAIDVQRGAELVRVTNREPGRECKFLGDVTGSQGNRFTGGFTSDANLETGARNDLKNKAFALGGNVVYILTQRESQTGRSRDRKNVTLSGNVYRCLD
jgi:hypothetical protein